MHEVQGLSSAQLLALREIGGLADAAFAQLLATMSNVRPNAMPSEAEDLLEATVEDMSIGKGDLVSALILLRRLAFTEGANPLAAAQAVVETMDEELADDEASVFTERLDRLLRVAVVSMAAKGASLASEHERKFAGCRVLTDVRPNFPDGLDDEIASGVIVHDLRLDYWRSGRFDSIFVGLDESDLIELRLAIERAQEKAATLRNWLSQVKFDVIPVED